MKQVEKLIKESIDLVPESTQEDVVSSSFTPKKAYFEGGSNYRNSNDHFPYGGYRSEGLVLVIAEDVGAKHPYRVRPIRGTTASGWVDKDLITIKED